MLLHSPLPTTPSLPPHHRSTQSSTRHRSVTIKFSRYPDLFTPFSLTAHSPSNLLFSAPSGPCGCMTPLSPLSDTSPSAPLSLSTALSLFAPSRLPISLLGKGLLVIRTSTAHLVNEGSDDMHNRWHHYDNHPSNQWELLKCGKKWLQPRCQNFRVKDTILISIFGVLTWKINEE